MPVTNTSSGIKAGTVAHFAAAAAPTGWLKANGATISRTLYAALFTSIGTTYGAGDGATTFVIPDLRGEFLRGFDDGRGVDTARGIGTAQGQSIQAHTHAIPCVNSASDGTGGIRISATAENTNRTSGNAGNDETRPRNVSMLACIKY